MKDVQKVVAKLMISLQTEGEKGMVAVLDNSAPGNPLKSMEYKKVRVALVHRLLLKFLVVALVYRGACGCRARAPLVCMRHRRLNEWTLLRTGMRLHA